MLLPPPHVGFNKNANWISNQSERINLNLKPIVSGNRNKTP